LSVELEHVVELVADLQQTPAAAKGRRLKKTGCLPAAQLVY
jgi:hypothetical protein